VDKLGPFKNIQNPSKVILDLKSAIRS